MSTFCPECGFGIDIDEDGLCLHCGATAVGSAVDEMYAQINIYTKEINQLKNEIEKQCILANKAAERYAIQYEASMNAAKKEINRLVNLIKKIVYSGLLCDPGCCGDDCVCADLRKIVLSSEQSP